ERFTICLQNHDQVGNRAVGERLSTIVPFAAVKVAAALLFSAPALPLLFMGEEYGETSPFQYFTSHLDPALGEAVRKGRTEEFRSFGWGGAVPDPSETATFLRAGLGGVARAARQRGRPLRRQRRRAPAGAVPRDPLRSDAVALYLTPAMPRAAVERPPVTVSRMKVLGQIRKPFSCLGLSIGPP